MLKDLEENMNIMREKMRNIKNEPMEHIPGQTLGTKTSLTKFKKD